MSSWPISPLDELLTPEKLLERPLRSGYAIDPPNPHEVDDAIRVEKIAKNEWHVSVLVADGGLLADDQALLDYARSKGASLYDEDDPSFVEPMLPEIVSKQQVGLDVDTDFGIPAIEVSFDFDFLSRRTTNHQTEYVRALIELEDYDSFIQRTQEDEDAARLIEVGRRLNRQPDEYNVFDNGMTAYYTVGHFMVAANSVVAEHIFPAEFDCLFRNHGDQRTFDSWRDPREREILTKLRYASYGRVATGHLELKKV